MSNEEANEQQKNEDFKKAMEQWGDNLKEKLTQIIFMMSIFFICFILYMYFILFNILNKIILFIRG